MDILDELKKENETKQGKSETPEAIASEINTYQHSILLGRLRQIHDYLNELSNNLNHLNYTTTVDVQIPEFGVISNLHQNNYELLWENRANQNQVALHFSTNIQDSCPLNLDQENNDEIKKILEQCGINFSNSQNDIIVDGDISSSIIFSVNPEEHNINLMLNNFKQLGKQQYTLNEKLINDDFFDQLGRFLIHRENNFIEIISLQTSVQSEQLTDDELYDQDSGHHTQEMDVSRVRSLFNKEVQLYLTYHNTIKEINTKSDDFIIGRSKKSNIIVNSDLASRHHAKIVYRKGKYVLIDQSTNGTFVKTQGGKEVYVQQEELPLSGSGFISLGKSVTVDNEHIIYFSCQ